MQNGNSNFCFSEVDDDICKSLANNEGINPTEKSKHSDCEDLKALNDLGMGDVHNSLKFLDMCDVEAWKCWLFSLVTWIWNINKAMICAICGLWDALDKQNWEINTKYEITEETPGMSVTIDRTTGDFEFKYSDWIKPSDPTSRIGQGIITGTVNFGMRSADNGAFDWQIRDVLVKKIEYISDGKNANIDFVIHLYVKDSSEQEIYTKAHNSNSSFSENINKTIKIDKKGTVKKGESSGWIQFLELYNDNLQTSLDDRANVKIEFKNNNKGNPPAYIE
ncbi:hypothetical protein BG262_02935 [Floricoccus penangensis]|uniref:Adhesin BspA variable domain-containing protein n=1 Tax=Floricoccus penangensis TaxID=1859475 RepID=A0A9Q5JGJ5_9LACT|nr:hypothetical protein BG262_02935 [Floricoccus penangensis]